MPEAIGGAAAPFKFSSPDGLKHVKSILSKHLPYEPHDYQLEGVCHSLDGTDLLALLPTGAGKTAYFSMYMLALVELSKNPFPTGSPLSIPKDPAMIVVYPTLGLEEEMAKTFKKLGLSTLVINHRTVQEYTARKENIWRAARSGVSMLLLSPEMLQSDGFRSLSENQEFVNRVCALGVDEVHLCNTWGVKFRKSYNLIGFVRALLPGRVTLVLTTATLLAGPFTNNVLNAFGLHRGEFHLIQRSNLRHNIQIIHRTLSRSASGVSFPDLHFVLEQKRKTIIFAKTTQQVRRIRDYLLLQLASKNIVGSKHVRKYTALDWSDNNTDTLRLFREDSDMHIIVATDALMVGIDMPNVQDVVIVSGVDDLDSLLQKVGRAGRDTTLVPDARGIIYLMKTAVKTAQTTVEQTHQKKKKKSADGNQSGEMDVGLANFILAPCKTQEQNRLYDNPAYDLPCTCSTCAVNPPFRRVTCNCSGCLPEPMSIAEKPPKKVHPVKQGDRLSRAMKAHGKEAFLKLRDKIYDNADDLEAAVIPKSRYLPDSLIDEILDRFALLRHADQLALDNTVQGYTYVWPHRQRLWVVIAQLGPEFDNMRVQHKAFLAAERVKKAAQKSEEACEGNEAQIQGAEAENMEKGAGSDRSDEGSDAEPESQDEEDYNVNFSNNVTNASVPSTPSRRSKRKSDADHVVGLPSSPKTRRRLQDKENLF